jgi:hypothetical protein
LLQLVDPAFFLKPLIIETQDAIVADAVCGVCGNPWIISHPISQMKVSGHGPTEVIAVARWTKKIFNLESLGFEFADPVTLCQYIKEKGGWPVDPLRGSLKIGTIWDEIQIIGFAFRRGSRIDVENYMIPDVVIMMKSPA